MRNNQVNVKVYGNIHPADEVLLTKLERACADAAALNIVEDQPLFKLDGDVLQICFEGVYFPVDDLLAALKPGLVPSQQGKVDYFDLEAWMLSRFLISGGKLSERKIPINNALEKI